MSTLLNDTQEQSYNDPVQIITNPISQESIPLGRLNRRQRRLIARKTKSVEAISDNSGTCIESSDNSIVRDTGLSSNTTDITARNVSSPEFIEQKKSCSCTRDIEKYDEVQLNYLKSRIEKLQTLNNESLKIAIDNNKTMSDLRNDLANERALRREENSVLNGTIDNHQITIDSQAKEISRLSDVISRNNTVYNNDRIKLTNDIDNLHSGLTTSANNELTLRAVNKGLQLICDSREKMIDNYSEVVSTLENIINSSLTSLLDICPGYSERPFLEKIRHGGKTIIINDFNQEAEHMDEMYQRYISEKHSLIFKGLLNEAAAEEESV